MAAKRHGKGHAIAVVVLCAVLVCVVAALTLYFLIDRRVNALNQGASFDFSYQVVSTADETPALYTILQRVGSTQGSVRGQYAPGKLQLALYSDTSPDEPFTRVYIDQDETLYDAGQLYAYLRQLIVSSYALADSFLPQWSLGDYISQTQLAQVLGVELDTVELQDMTAFSLALGALQRVQPEGALDGYTYFQMDSSEGSATLILGLPLRELFAETTPLHLLLSIPEHQVTVQLSGTLSAADTVVTAPTSRMAEDDIARFAQIRETVEGFLTFLQELSSSSGTAGAA